jgi:hypothetical protein
MSGTSFKIRKAEPREVESLAEIGYAAWERDLLPFFKDSAELRRGEQRRLRQAVRDQLDRIIVAETPAAIVGCARAPSAAATCRSCS